MFISQAHAAAEGRASWRWFRNANHAWHVRSDFLLHDLPPTSETC